MFVYFARPIGQRGPVKIGCSLNTEARLSTLMTWSPLPLEIAARVEGDATLERRLHSIFRAHHSHREWFNPNDELDDLISRLQKGEELGSIIDLTADVVPFNYRKNWRTPEYRVYASYAGRMRWAFLPLHQHKSGPYAPPNDVSEILSRWLRSGVRPSANELARLEAVIANPVEHGRPLRIWSKARAAA